MSFFLKTQSNLTHSPKTLWQVSTAGENMHGYLLFHLKEQSIERHTIEVNKKCSLVFYFKLTFLSVMRHTHSVQAPCTNMHKLRYNTFRYLYVCVHLNICRQVAMCVRVSSKGDLTALQLQVFKQILSSLMSLSIYYFLYCRKQLLDNNGTDF